MYSLFMIYFTIEKDVKRVHPVLVNKEKHGTMRCIFSLSFFGIAK
jgi:hypothetical protein